jgi:hypothetical protein
MVEVKRGSFSSSDWGGMREGQSATTSLSSLRRDARRDGRDRMWTVAKLISC